MEEDDKGYPMIRMGVSGLMFLVVPAYPGSPGQKAVKRLCVCVCSYVPISDNYYTVMNCYQHLYCRLHMAILQPSAPPSDVFRYHNLSFIHIDSHAFTLHVIFPLIKTLNQLVI